MHNYSTWYYIWQTDILLERREKGLKNIFEEIMDMLVEIFPMLLFISIMAALVIGGYMNGWLDKIASWMFG